VAADQRKSSAPGDVAAAFWLSSVTGISPDVPRWHVEIALDVTTGRAPSEFDDATATRFHLDIYAEEWGVYFCHAGRSSWIRVTDVSFVHGRDDYQLLSAMPPLREIGTLVRKLEDTHGVVFQRESAIVRTNLPALEPTVRRWLTTL